MSSRRLILPLIFLSPLPLLLLRFLPRRPLLALALLSVLMGSGVSWLRGRFIGMLPFFSVLEAATWSSASVFTSFYLSDVQFSSSQGFGLGPVVAAGAVA